MWKVLEIYNVAVQRIGFLNMQNLAVFIPLFLVHNIPDEVTWC
jgi:hypothetical protein